MIHHYTMLTDINNYCPHRYLMTVLAQLDTFSSASGPEAIYRIGISESRNPTPFVIHFHFSQ